MTDYAKINPSEPQATTHRRLTPIHYFALGFLQGVLVMTMLWEMLK